MDSTRWVRAVPRDVHELAESGSREGEYGWERGVEHRRACTTVRKFYIVPGMDIVLTRVVIPELRHCVHMLWDRRGRDVLSVVEVDVQLRLAREQDLLVS